MLQLKNSTPFKATIAAMPDAEGIDAIWAIVKGTFTIGDVLSIAELQAEIALADTYLGEPAESSVRTPSDIGLKKPGTDVLLLGHAYAPQARRAKEVDVSIRIGPVSKRVRVFGDRVWGSGIVRSSISTPEPFERIPLIWERAFGGLDVVDGRTPETHGEGRNPVGAGFRVKNGRKPLNGLRLPNLEEPRSLISDWQDRPAPACFAPLCAHWEPRRSFAGTYDERWLKRRAPYLPEDFDSRFFQIAPTDLISRGHLRGDESIEVSGATPSGKLQCRLPGQRIEVTFLLDDERLARMPVLDTVLIEPDEGRVVLVWRSMLRCDKKLLRVREIAVTSAVSG